MKKFLLLLIGFQMIASAGQSQSTDSITLPVDQVKKILTAAQQKKVLDSLVTLYRTDIDILMAQINHYERMIWEAEYNDSLNMEVIVSYKSTIDVLQKQKSVYEDHVKALNKENKKLRRKVRMTAILGVVASALAFYLGAK